VSVSRDPIFDQAVAELTERARKKQGSLLDIFKRFRKIQEHRLKIWHNAGGGGREIARRRSDLVDVLFRELFEQIAGEISPKNSLEDSLTVVAFGGYGRREMNPFSDVDIMFLTAKSNPGKTVEELIRRVMMALWDLGYKVGHSVRSIAQAITQANADMLTKTSMLECRYLLGSRDLFNDFKERFEKSCVNGHEAPYIEWRLANMRELQEKFGASVFMQEPNIKGGCGGLREYQNLLWISFFKERILTTAKLVEKKFLRETERRHLEQAYDFLLRVRTEMHYLNDRPIDILTLRLQGQVATSFGYPQRNILRRCEAFMRDYYQHTRNIHQIAQAVIARLEILPARHGSNLLQILQLKKVRTEKFDGLAAKDGYLYPVSRDIFNEDSSRLMRVFQHAQRRQLELSPELRDLIMRRVRLVDRTFRYARVNREVFLSILSHKGRVGPILRTMHELGLLGKYLPEFGALTCLVQHEFFHRYTADEHTLVCIEKLDSILFSEDEKLQGYRALFQKQEDSAMLYLALLLHDTGKAANRRNHDEASAELAHRVARRLQLPPKRRRMLITLVDVHYSLSQISQQRNLDDLTTIVTFAGIVKNREILDALMLITLADGMGTSDEKWSDWKEALVWQLYRRTVAYLEHGPAAFDLKQKNLVEIRSNLKLPKSMEEEIEAHFQHMPGRYFRSFNAEQVREHLQLFHRFFEQRVNGDPLQPAIEWIQHPEQGHTAVCICGWDRQGLLEKIAGAFLAAEINILSADVFTRGDSLVLDLFRVCDTRHQPVTSPKDFARVESRLTEALHHEDYDFRPLLAKEARMKIYRLSQEAELPTRIAIENEAHPIYSIIEIQTPDRLGLLYDLLRAFSQADVHIELSRITTEMDVAMDSFYVTTAGGRKITDKAAIARLQKLLLKASSRRGEQAAYF